MKTTPEQLNQWLTEPEGVRLEFKEAKYRYDFDKLVQYCVALANEGGGKIILGVTDQRPRRIVGTAAFEEPGRTEAGLHTRLSHRIPVEEMQLPEGRVLVVRVPGRLPGTAWQIDGRYLKRAGDDLTALGEAELKAMFAETGPDFSAELCPGASLGDLSLGTVALFRERWARKTGDERKRLWTDTETLTNAELLVDGQLTYAALILCGTRAALGRWLAQAELVFEYRSSDASGPAGDRVEFREGFFAWQDALWDKVNLRNEKQSYQDGLFRMDLLTFDEVPVREALLNAVTHRDYRLGGSVFVRQYPQRLEVVSPGGFPPGITAANVLDQQNPRNRRLAEALAKCGLIERSGQGMNLMFETAIRQGKALPSFAGTAAHEVRLTLDGKVSSPAFVRFLERIGEQTLRSFSTDDFLALDALHREQPLKASLKERLPGLLAMGAVESMGRGKGARYMLSKALYAAMGAKGTHTRKKGLDHETNKALLLKHVSSQGRDGAPLAELRQVLPALPGSAVQSLMNELRKGGSVYLDGQRRWARWKLSEYRVYKAEDL
ncbi:MAG: transcriptional regulator [Comamonadaceae bacterium]|nr:transcriptional regulator [Comamonadaceae bacterium]